MKDGLVMAAAGVVAGAIGGFLLARLAASYVSSLRMPDALSIIGSVFVLMAAAVIASALPAARAARVDAMQALRSE